MCAGLRGKGDKRVEAHVKADAKAERHPEHARLMLKDAINPHYVLPERPMHVVALRQLNRLV